MTGPSVHPLTEPHRRCPFRGATRHPGRVPEIPAPAPSAADLIAHVTPGSSVVLPVANGEPRAILDALEDSADSLDGVRVHQLLARHPRRYHSGVHGDRLRHVSYFLGPDLRPHFEAGQVDLVPNDFHAVPALMRRLPNPILAVATSPPDRHGYVSLGVSADYTAALLGELPLLVEVNPEMPRTAGEHTIHLSEALGWIEASTPLLCTEEPEPTAIDRRIADLVAERIPDGAVIQVGIGAVPGLVAGLLQDKSGLGIHSELFGDSLMHLVESGAAPGMHKVRERGLATATTVLGSAELYEWVDDNPALFMLPVDVSNDPRVIAQHRDFVAVNATMQVDLLGQCASESLGTHYVSSTGGQADFMCGAQLAEGGQSFIVTHSTAHDVASGDEVVSRIVPTLTPGAVVTAHKNLVDKVVTEHGVAELHGRSVRDRATALIAIAEPRFRDDLERQARAFGYL